MSRWIVELKDGKRVFFSSRERAESFALGYETERGVRVAVHQEED